MFDRKTSNTGLEEDCNLLFECDMVRIFQSMKVELKNKGKEYMDPHVKTSANSFQMAVGIFGMSNAVITVLFICDIDMTSSIYRSAVRV